MNVYVNSSEHHIKVTIMSAILLSKPIILDLVIQTPLTAVEVVREPLRRLLEKEDKDV